MFKRDDIPQCFAFELSNRCNLSRYHPKCPTKADAEPIILSTKIIKDTIDYFGEQKYNGTIYFNIYNEPMNNPRLLMLMHYVKEHCGCNMNLWTNGWYLDQNLVNEINDLGVHITVTSYSDKDKARVDKLNGKLVSNQHELDGRMDIYSQPSTNQGKCHFPSTYGMINHKGYLVLCCMDCEYTHHFADLNVMGIKEALGSDERIKICEELESGARTLDVCKKCKPPGWGI